MKRMLMMVAVAIVTGQRLGFFAGATDVKKHRPMLRNKNIKYSHGTFFVGRCD